MINISLINRAKRIGISMRVVNASNYDEKRDALSRDWIYFFEKLDVFPILVPNNMPNVKDFLHHIHVDGLILSGGDNIGDNPERDKTEKEMIEYSISSNIPLFGVCRGMQVINRYFDGTVLKSNDSKHVAKPHHVKIYPPIYEMLKIKAIEVNSYHHNIIAQEHLGKGLRLFAEDQDDHTVEGIYHEKFPLSGVMWHPERNQNQYNVEIVKKMLVNISDKK